MSARDLAAAGLCLVPGVAWVLIAGRTWALLTSRQPTSRAMRLMPIVWTAFALDYFLLAAEALVPGTRIEDAMRMIERPIDVLHEVAWLATMPLLRHLLRLLPLPERPPGRTWLLVNYGLAAATVGTAVGLWLEASDPAGHLHAHLAFEAGFNVLGLLCLVDLIRYARPGVWGPEHAGELRRPDLVIIGIGVGAACLAFPLVWRVAGGDAAHGAFEVMLGLAIAAVSALRFLGFFVTEIVTMLVLLAVTAGLVGAHAVLLARVGPEWQALVSFGVVVAIWFAATSGQQGLRALVTRLVLHRGERQWRTLRDFLATVPPETGIAACCRQALAELVRTRQICGAAILLRDGPTLVEGTFDIEPLSAVWPRGDAIDTLPAGTFGTPQLRELPLALREGLTRANVGLGVATIQSPRRRWGHLFMNTGLFGGTFLEDDADQLRGVASQLALLLDAADLLARTVAVERTLAHAEKLAAIGELAARFAHDIRNPVTAARSLAQELARDPTAAANREHAGIILEELERVERQVRDLLRFARREEFRLAPVDVGQLARATVDGFRSRLEAGGVAVEVAAAPAVVVPADLEKLRQVFVNLIENALDVLADAPAKRVVVAVGREDGHASVRVTDSGPGVPADALGHLFEPFYSRKASGTGLGLAIAKRTIDALGGQIEVSQRPGEGLTFAIELPLAAEAAA